MPYIVGCDLQPKITALPDTVGDFISARYPALLADPNTQPEIYNSAATDYGVYAAPELYGTGVTTDDYVLYASVDDYIVPPDDNVVPEPDTTESNVNTEPAQDEVPDTPNVDDVLVVGNRVVDESPEQKPDGKTEPETDGDDAPWAETNDVLNIPKYMYGGHNETEITVVRGDTLYAIGAKYGMRVAEIAELNNLSEPYSLSVGQKLRVRASVEQVVTEIPKMPETKPTPKPAPKVENKPETKPVAKQDTKPITTGRATTTRVELSEVKVTPGDTLYSLSRKYSIPVNDLAVMNNLTPPFALYAGQSVRVPNLGQAQVRVADNTTAKASSSATKTPAAQKSAPATPKQAKANTAHEQPKSTPKQNKKTEQTKPQQQKTPAKQSTGNAVKKLPAIAARSSSRFSWPIRGKILSGYGSKSKGLFNDGINIAAKRGASVSAAENGAVAYAGNEVKGMGNLIIIQHSDGWMTVYAHMDSLAVRRGARVSVGQKIGTVGQTGKVDQPQLHFEIRRGTKAYNPIQYLKK
ncbi:MAG: peptidoglycan DD-metalloendopeptidase family protein [Alphaproteobacteria bacterium]|nr:peptidoglycan DD-metalloendopeptidase family protein [Alphaproteobacteria bacterium]